MKISFAIMAAGLYLLLAPIVAPAGDEAGLAVEYQYFSVPYLPNRSVHELVIANSPLRVRANNHVASGNARWSIKYGDAKFSRPKIGVCRLESVTVTSRCLISLPRLEGGDEEARREFAVYLAELKEHELEHCRIAAAHADGLREAFGRMKDLPCDEVGQKMRDIYEPVFDDCQVAQNRFDHQSYGYSQYLEMEKLYRLMEAGFNLSPPAEGHWKPRLDHTRRSGRTAITLDETFDLADQGFYRDQDGVWRNGPAPGTSMAHSENDIRRDENGVWRNGRSPESPPADTAGPAVRPANVRAIASQAVSGNDIRRDGNGGRRNGPAPETGPAGAGNSSRRSPAPEVFQASPDNDIWVDNQGGWRVSSSPADRALE